MKELGNFFESVREDCSDTPLVEAVEQATRCIFAEAAETEAPATTETATETITDEPTAEETAPTADDGLNLDATPAPDADTVNSEPDNGTAPEPQAEGGETTEPAAPEVTGTETAETVNQTPAPGMDPKELVTKFVMSGAVRKAQDDMVQTGNTSLVDFEKNIAAALAKFCVDNQIPTLSEADGVKIAKALAIRYGRAK